MGGPVSRWEVMEQDTQQPPLASLYAQVSTLSTYTYKPEKSQTCGHLSIYCNIQHESQGMYSTGVKKKCLPISTDRMHLAKTTQAPVDSLHSMITVPSGHSTLKLPTMPLHVMTFCALC